MLYIAKCLIYKMEGWNLSQEERDFLTDLLEREIEELRNKKRKEKAARNATINSILDKV